MTSGQKCQSTIPLLTAAILANGAAGLLYVWSLFILPIEAAQGLNRADLGLISSAALISFTVGASIMPAILARVGRIAVAVFAFALIAGGHLVVGLWPSWLALLLGYGLAFGAGSGIAYGFALSLAASLPARIRARGIGVAMGAFALSGILLPIILGNWISVTAPHVAFLRIGLFVLAVGVLCVLALLRVEGEGAGDSEAPGRPTNAPLAVDRPFLILSLIFFLICFTGLAVISQAAAIASASGIASSGFAATALTLGYLCGSLFGAPLAERLGERPILIVLGLLTLIGALAMFSGVQAALLPAAALIGMAFGGSGSIMPVLLGLRYGAANISRLYGRMIIAYGLAGLIAPGVAGLLFQSAQSYAPVLGLCAALAAFAIGAAMVIGGSEKSR
jgi:OFA family oxalate/formate antiporter-like MFS transporter